MTFEELGIDPAIIEAIHEMGYRNPTEIQEKTIPFLIDHEKDFVAQAQTGTGKTAAFGLPLLQRIDFNSPVVQAFILTPTRELASQVSQELEKFGKNLPLKIATIYGGVSYDKQISQIKRKRPQIIVGTPGRTIDLIEKSVLKLSHVQYLIIDEADEMLNMGFLEDVETIIKSLHSEKKTWMFSATMPDSIQALIENNFHSPKILKTKKKSVSNENIDQRFCVVKRKNFHQALIRILQCEADFYGIAFCETKRETQELADKLGEHGIAVASLHGDLSQYQRDLALNAFKQRKVQILTCTDVAARGIDINDITHVINIGIPRQHESYVHRIGRTARAGSKGTAITFITPFEKRTLKRLSYTAQSEITPLALPSASQIKITKVKNEMEKMLPLKEAIQGKGDGFRIDESFNSFKESFSDMDQEEVLKLFFSWVFNKSLRQIDDLGSLEAPEENEERDYRRDPRKRSRPRRNGERSSSRGGNSHRGASSSRGGNSSSQFSRRKRRPSYSEHASF